ncbi:DUF4928 family protein [Azospirillum sp. TSH58]|uniref:DUF4928 family protein n=1 Tax=Azospirillum sp. TSH58 TaxID=664962 RepID=UPI0018EEC3E5
MEQFARERRFRGKGPLCVALVVTEHARTFGMPLDPERLLTDRGGQVLGLGRAQVQAILGRHHITRVLAEEGGRTSRGSIDNMRAYVTFLNEQHAAGNFDWEAAKSFWIGKVKEHFAARPFTLRVDHTLGLRAVIRNLLSQAEARQREMQGTMFVGAVMQHLVGAKLDVVLGVGRIEHHGSNQNDQADGRTGDFDVGDVSIHVSTAPSEALVRKCSGNLDAGRKPIIVTGKRGAPLAEGLAENAGIGDRVDIIEFEQFIAMNIHELGRFAADGRRIRIEELIERYNAIVGEHETDPSLRIEIAQGR